MAGKLATEISITDMPWMIASLRDEMASILREVADAEVSVYVAERLRAVAAAFQAGQREES